MGEIDYSQFIGCYAKRFYTPFERANIYKIIGVRGKGLDSFLEVAGGKLPSWEWDIEDSIIITDGGDTSIDPERVIDVNNENYKGHNPYL